MPPRCFNGKCDDYKLPHLRDPKKQPYTPTFSQPTFVNGKPVCPSGSATQSSMDVQKPDGTWTTVSVGVWMCKYPKTRN